MLIRKPFRVEVRCPRRWSLLAATLLLSVAVLAAGVGLSRADDTRKDDRPAPKDVTKDQTKKDEPKQEDPQKDDAKDDRKPKKDESQKGDKKPKKDDPLLPGFPDIDEFMKRLPGGLDDDIAKQIRQQLEETRKMLEQMRKQMPGGGAGGAGGFPGLPGQPGLPGLPGGIIPFPQIPQLQPRGFNRFGAGMTEPRLGVQLTKPPAAMVDQLDLPRNQGLIIEELKDDAAGAKGGLKRHDVLLEIDGKPVSSDLNEFRKQLADVKADKAVDAVVLRKSKKETIKGLKLPEAKEKPGLNAPFRFQINPFGGGAGAGGIGGAGGGIFGGLGGLGGVTTFNLNNGEFTATNKDGGVTVTVKGTVEAGKARASEITVDDGDKSKTYDSVEKVPAEYRDKVQGLLKVGEVGKVRNFRLR